MAYKQMSIMLALLTTLCVTSRSDGQVKDSEKRVVNITKDIQYNIQNTTTKYTDCSSPCFTKLTSFHFASSQLPVLDQSVAKCK
jgi:hypothetical protein